MPDARTELASLDSFLAVLAREGIAAVVLRVVKEIRPITREKHAVDVGLQKWIELNAYKAGTVYALKLAEAEGDEIERELKGRGLRVRRVSGNVT